MTSTPRARVFGAVAGAYAAHRPSYPAEAVAWASCAPVRDRPALRMLDLGAGTGKLTRELVAVAGAGSVVAVDPDPRMLAELRNGLPGVPTRDGGAEAIPLPDASVDVVVAGQAWHWFDHDRAAPEIARVLRPGGVLAVVWNDEDDSAPWMEGLLRALHPEPEPRMGSTPSDDHPVGPAFAPPERRTFPNPRTTTADGLIGTLSTHSWALLAEPAERDAAFARVRAYLASRPETAGGSFTVPYVTTVARTLRR